MISINFSKQNKKKPAKYDLKYSIINIEKRLFLSRVRAVNDLGPALDL